MSVASNVRSARQEVSFASHFTGSFVSGVSMHRRSGFRRNSLNGLFQSLSLCLTALVPVAAFAELSSAADPLQQELVLDIAPDTPLDEALLKWSALSHVEVMMSSESLAHKKP